MKLSVEISMYPLNEDFVPPILEFIDSLNQSDLVDVFTSHTSTQVFGDYQDVMNLLQRAMRISFEKYGKVVFVTKFLKGDVRNLQSGE